MKKMILFLSLLLLGKVCDAQSLTYDDLEYVLLHDFNSSRDYLFKIGFGIRALSRPPHDDITYEFTKNEGLNYISIDKTDNEIIAFTYSEEEYLFLKKSIDNLNFKLDSTIMIWKVNPSSYYHKGNLKINFCSTPTSHMGRNGLIRGYSITISEIEMEKKHDPDKWRW
jgi:hypothetical protein